MIEYMFMDVREIMTFSNRFVAANLDSIFSI